MVLSVALAVVLGFVAIPDQQAIALVSLAGFWFVLVTFAIWVWSLGRSFAPEFRSLRWRGLDWVSVAVVALGGVVLLAHESFGFKIVMDELMLLGTSMGMHFDKAALTPLRGNDIQGAFMILEGIVDKRPLFFPFLVSLLHDVTGYRPANAFVLNAGLTFVLLGLIFILGRALAGRVVGWIGVALFAGLPLLAQNCTGGGFELLNLVMILGTLLLGARYVERRDDASLVAFAFSALLLAQVRYESVIFLVPVALLAAWVWWREGRVALPWPLLLAPLLMVHYPLQHRIFDLRASAWEMASKPGYTTPFSVSYIPESLLNAMKFFFSAPSDQPNSLVLSVLGWLAVPFFALLVLKRARALAAERPVSVAVTIFSLGFALQFGLMMCYVWGFHEVVTRRLSLPVHLGLIIAILAVLPQLAKPAVARLLLGLAVLGLIARSVPSMAAHAYSQEYTPGREVAWRREFMARQPRPDYLMIDNDSTLWVTHLVSSTPSVSAMKERREGIAYHMRNRTFSAVYVFQRYEIDPETGAMTLRKGDDLGPSFVLEPVVEQRLQVLTLSRISRVTEIRNDTGVISTPDPGDRPVPRSRAEIEKARQAFLERFMKQLP